LSLLRVLHVYKDVHPPVVGGIEKHIDSVRRAMPRVRSDVLACARGPRTTRREVAGGVQLLVAEAPLRAMAVPVAPTFPRWLKRWPADVVHVHMPNPLGETSALLALGDRPLVLSYHADIVRQARFRRLYRPLVRACIDRASAILVSNKRFLETSPFLADRADRISVLPYGVDVDRFSPDAVSEDERERVRARFGGGPIVAATGRLVYYKGFEHLIEVAQSLPAQVVIVGDGPRRAMLQALARNVPNVHLTGEVSEPELVRILAAADCFVLPSSSRAESFGIATLEAQAMELPAVITDVGTGTIDAIDPARTGLVVPPNDGAALAAAIDRLLGDPVAARSMGQAGRQRVITRHSLTERAGELQELYERVA
jgi:glycosyltransferase involved in cell wall biosynthesis